MTSPPFPLALRRLTDAAVLLLWDQTGSLTPTQRTWELLRRALSESDLVRLAQAPLSQAHAAILQLRRQQFGDAFHILDRCPQCSDPIEFQLEATTLLQGLTPPSNPNPPDLHFEDWTLHLRPLGLNDLVQVVPGPSPEANGRQLMSRTLTSSTRHQQPSDPALLPQAAWEAIAQVHHDWDPGAEILIQLRCPQCEHSWASLFDPGAYLWLEIVAYARTLQAQVHTLASAYGWRESDILDLSPERRAAYTALILDSHPMTLSTLPRPPRHYPS